MPARRRRRFFFVPLLSSIHPFHPSHSLSNNDNNSISSSQPTQPNNARAVLLAGTSSEAPLNSQQPNAPHRPFSPSSRPQHRLSARPPSPPSSRACPRVTSCAVSHTTDLRAKECARRATGRGPEKSPSLHPPSPCTPPTLALIAQSPPLSRPLYTPSSRASCSHRRLLSSPLPPPRPLSPPIHQWRPCRAVALAPSSLPLRPTQHTSPLERAPSLKLGAPGGSRAAACCTGASVRVSQASRCCPFNVGSSQGRSQQPAARVPTRLCASSTQPLPTQHGVTTGPGQTSTCACAGKGGGGARIHFFTECYIRGTNDILMTHRPSRMLRSYHHESTRSHQNSEVKRGWARLVLG